MSIYRTLFSSLRDDNIGQFQAIVRPYIDQINDLEAGNPILVKTTEGDYSLLLFESYSFNAQHHSVHPSDLYPIGLYRLCDEAYADASWIRYLGCIRGPLIRFQKDVELDAYLPTSESTTVWMCFAREDLNGCVVRTDQEIEIYTDPDRIVSILQGILPNRYFERYVKLFLAQKHTHFALRNGRDKKHISNADLEVQSTSRERLENLAQGNPHGSLVYLGSNSEVWVLRTCLDNKGRMIRKRCGRAEYASLIPPISFTCAGLGGRLHARQTYIDESCYDYPDEETRNHSIQFDGKPFIFPMIGRTQRSLATKIFSRKYDTMTVNKDEMRDHFSQTHFREFMPVFEKFLNLTIDDVIRKPNFKDSAVYYD